MHFIIINSIAITGVAYLALTFLASSARNYILQPKAAQEPMTRFLIKAFYKP